MTDDMMRTVEAAVRSFVAAEPGRRAAVMSLRGPKVEIAFGGEDVVPAASLIKLPLAVTVTDAARDGSGGFDLNTLVACGELGVTAYPSILQVFRPDRLLTVAELTALMLATSDNPISQYLLDLVGAEAVTATAAKLGAEHTSMAVGYTDDLLGTAGRANVTTAHDMVQMFTAVATEPCYRPLLTAMRNSMRNVRIPLRLPDELHVPHKTGSLAGLANDAGIIFGARTDLAVAFLTDGQSDTAQTSTAIGDCVAAIWTAVGEDL